MPMVLRKPLPLLTLPELEDMWASARRVALHARDVAMRRDASEKLRLIEAELTIRRKGRVL